MTTPTCKQPSKEALDMRAEARAIVHLVKRVSENEAVELVTTRLSEAYATGGAERAKARLEEADVAKIIFEHTDYVQWKNPQYDGHISRFTEALNSALEQVAKEQP